jgi:two-component system sensor histidine kinase VicK
MSVVGFFIVTQSEKIQLDANSKIIRSRVSYIYSSSNALKSDNWLDNVDNIKNGIESSIQLGYNENVYIILNNDKKTIIASSVLGLEQYSAYDNDRINSGILVKSISGEAIETIVDNELDNTHISHISYPVKNNNGDIKGYIYLTNDIGYINDTIVQTRDIFMRATAIVLLLTIVFGFIMSKSISGPIKTLTDKARQMSQGDFNQKVEIKSDDEIGHLGEMFNFLTDELETSMFKLNQEKSKIETTLTYMADGVLTVDKNGNIVHINPIAKRILSVRTKDVLYDQIISRKTHDLYLDKLESNKWNGTHILETEKETYKIDYAPYMDGQNQIGGVILVFKNITEQYRLDKQQKEFVANVSHELKTPITTIKSYTETLLEGALEEKELAIDFLKTINSESDRMSRLVSDLLKLSRMDHEKAIWTKEKISINEIVKDCCSKLNLQAKSKKVKLNCSYDSRNSNVLFDRDGLEQILLNIIGNAIKYTPEHGDVSVEISAETSRVVLSIKDTGIGIPKDDLNHVFERFYRVDKARTRQMGGTGLGLSIADQIAKAHDSTIEISSELHLGTTVAISMPKLLKG